MNRHHTSNGFSLFEMLLTIFIFASILFTAFIALRDYAEDTLARRTAAYYAEIHRALDEILQNPNNFTAIHNSLSLLTDPIAEVPLNDLINGGGIIPAPANNLNANFSATSPLKAESTIIIRIADNPADNTDIPALETIIVSNERRDDRRVRLAAAFAEDKGGFYRGVDSRISTPGTPPANHIESAFSTWDFPITNLAGTPLFTTIDTNAPSFTDGTYFVYYDHYNFIDLTGDYLFRVAVTGQPELNRMHSIFNLGGNSILGADDINPETLSLSAKAIVNGQMQTSGQTIVNDGNFIAGRRMEVLNNATINGEETGPRGNFSVQGAINATNATINQNVNTTIGNLNGGLNTTGQITAETINVNNNGSTAVSGNSFIMNLNSTAGGRPELDVGGQLNTSDVGTTSFETRARSFGALDMVVNGNTIVGRNARGSIVTINELDTNSFGRCNLGC